MFTSAAQTGNYFLSVPDRHIMANVYSKMAMCWDSQGRRGFFDAKGPLIVGTPAIGLNRALPGRASSAPTTWLNGAIKRFDLYPTRLSDLQLRQLTTPPPAYVDYVNPAIGTSLSLASLGIPSNGVCTVLVKSIITSLATGLVQFITLLDDGTNLSQVFLRHPSTGNSVVVGRNYNGFLGPTLGTIIAGTEFKAGMVVSGDGTVRGTLNGSSVISATGCPTTGLTTLRMGMASNGTSVMTGSIAKVRVYPNVVMTDAELRKAVQELDAVTFYNPAIGTSMTLASLGIQPNGLCTVLVKMTYTVAGSGTQHAITLHDGTLNNQIFLRQASNASFIATRTTNGTTVATGLVLGTIIANAEFKAGLVVPGDGTLKGCMNGGAISLNTGAPVTGLTGLSIGSNGTGGNLTTGSIAKVVVYPGIVLSDAELQAAVLALP
jgi:hypothetical protein